MCHCEKCNTSKLMKIDYCLHCGEGDPKKDLDKLTKQDLEYASLTPYGYVLINHWKSKRYSRTSDKFLSASILLQMNVQETFVRFSPRSKKLLALVSLLLGSLVVGLKYACKLI